MGLADWFRQRKQRRVTGLLERHAALSVAAVEELLKLAKAEGGSAKKVKQLETEADELRRGVIEELTRGEIRSAERTDFMDLIRNLDKVTNHLYNASKDLGLVEPKGKLRSHMLDMLETAKLSVESLSRCISLMAQGEKAAAMREADRVEALEEELDERYTGAKALLLREKGGAAEVLVLSELLLSLENVADSCEHCIDIIRVMLIRVW